MSKSEDIKWLNDNVHIPEIKEKIKFLYNTDKDIAEAQFITLTMINMAIEDTLTEEDIEDLVRFYQSPVGKKLIELRIKTEQYANRMNVFVRAIDNIASGNEV